MGICGSRLTTEAAAKGEEIKSKYIGFNKVPKHAEPIGVNHQRVKR